MKSEKLTPKETAEWLRVQQAEIKRAKVLLETMEKLINKLLKRTQAQGSKKQA